MTERVKLHSLYISGFKSFAYSALRATSQDGTVAKDYRKKRVTFGDITVLLGANGAGKSNVVSLFQMLEAVVEGRLQEFVDAHGGANSLLHFGAGVTSELEVEVTTARGFDDYCLVLREAPPDTLRFSTLSLGGVGADRNATLQDRIRSMLSGTRTFQFNDTSSTARIRRSVYIEDAHYLRRDAGNLAAFLLGLRTNHAPHYERIRHTIDAACPQFDDFELVPSALDSRTILLNWRSRYHRDYLMGPHQLSDGTLRFMALTTLLLQPTSMLPATIVIDEPELGLHPTAISILAGMVKEASLHCQVVLATQSPTLVDHFELPQIRPMAHTGGASTFLDLDSAGLQHWLQRYTLGEMWQKNLFRGGPEHV